MVDFYCPELKLAIEIDGPIHLQQIKEDKLRQRDIEETGIKFIRFKNRDVIDDIEEVLNKLRAFIEK